MGLTGRQREKITPIVGQIVEQTPANSAVRSEQTDPSVSPGNTIPDRQAHRIERARRRSFERARLSAAVVRGAQRCAYPVIYAGQAGKMGIWPAECGNR